MMLPKSLGRFLYKIFYRLSKVIPLSRRPRTRVIVVLNDRETLLIKNWFGRQQWTLPGGGIKPGERPEQAAARELFEETGIQANPTDLSYVGQMAYANSPFSVYVYRLDVKDQDSQAAIPKHARFEISDLAWHPIVNLPLDRHVVVDQALTQQ